MMRLTLRTMLAFLDDVLEGPIAKELEQKIDESKFASDLVHRIRSSMRRLRLGAPKVAGHGIGADANSVAEYLDNTLPAEQVPEFEKVCLESDVQLAEVAACHQVLTIVLGEPAVIEPAMRERIYRIGYPQTSTDPARSGSTGSDSNAAVVHGKQPPAAGQEGSRPGGDGSHDLSTPGEGDSAEGVSRSSRNEKRKLLEQTGGEGIQLAGRLDTKSTFPFKSLAITLVLGFIVAAVALRAIHPFDQQHPVWRLFAGGPAAAEVALQPEADPTGGVIAISPGVETAPDSPAPDAPVGVPQLNPPESIPSPEQPQAPPPRPATADTKTADTATTNTATDRPSAVPIVPPGRTDDATTVAAPPLPVEPAAPPATAAVGPGEPMVPAAPARSGIGLTQPPAATGGPGPGLAPDGRTEKPAAPLLVGRYISEGQVLARMDPAQNAWMVLSPDTPLAADEPLLSLPAYRPQVLLAPSVKLTVVGEAYLRLREPEADSVPRVTLDHGRLVLIPVGEMGAGLQVDLGGRGGRLVFLDSQSMAAIEVRHYLPPGADPIAEPANLVVQIWAASGSVEWQEPDHPAVKLNAGERLQFIDETPVAVVDAAPVPDWIEGKNLGDLERIERRASQTLAEFLTTDRPLALSLMEQTNYRQVEVRTLACRSLCFLDIFEPAIAAFADSQQRTYWPGMLAAIQSTLPFGRDTVMKLRADLEKLHGNKGEQILDLLKGYSPEQLAAGGAAALVDALEDQLMVIRVIAFLNLNRITERTNLFRPEERPDQERPRVEKWRRSLKDGQIVYKTPPSPLPRGTLPTATPLP